MGILDVPYGVNPIDVRKGMNMMISEARKAAKPSRCILCGREQTSFCNSHSVPQLVLRSIASKGIVLHASALMGFNEEIVDIENGVNKSGTFNYICRSCDNSFFQDYENETNLLKIPTDKMMAEIAVKNMLLLMNKRAVERELAAIQQKKFNSFVNIDDLLGVESLDSNEFENEMFLHKKIADNNEIGSYQLLFWKIIPYTIPIAAQSAFVLPYDMERKLVNNVYNLDPNVRMQYVHLCLFPLKGQSVVFAFYHKRDYLYERLNNQINSSSEDDTLQFLNYLVFAYTENIFISKTIEPEIENNESLRKLSLESNGIPMLGFLNMENFFGMGYIPVKKEDIPNFLDRKWAVVDNN